MKKLNKIADHLQGELQTVNRVQELESTMKAEIKALDIELDRLAAKYAEGRTRDTLHDVNIEAWYLNRFEARRSCKAYLDLAHRAGKTLATTKHTRRR